MDKNRLNAYVAGSFLAIGAFTGLQGLSEMSKAVAYGESAQAVNGDAADTNASSHPEIDQAAKRADENAEDYFIFCGVSLFAGIAVRAWLDKRA